MTYQAKVFAGGKIVIPADIRRDLGIKEGGSLVVERDENGGRVFRTSRQVAQEALVRLRAMSGGSSGSVVDELIADRRAEAARERIR